MHLFIRIKESYKVQSTEDYLYFSIYKILPTKGTKITLHNSFKMLNTIILGSKLSLLQGKKHVLFTPNNHVHVVGFV